MAKNAWRTLLFPNIIETNVNHIKVDSPIPNHARNLNCVFRCVTNGNQALKNTIAFALDKLVKNPVIKELLRFIALGASSRFCLLKVKKPLIKEKLI